MGLHLVKSTKCLLLMGTLIPCLSFSQASWELDWLQQLAGNRTSGKNAFYQTLSDANKAVTVGIPIGWLAYGIMDKNKRITREGMTWTAAQLVNGALTYGLKAAVNRPRPAASDPTLIALEDVRIHSFHPDIPPPHSRWPLPSASIIRSGMW